MIKRPTIAKPLYEYTELERRPKAMDMDRKTIEQKLQEFKANGGQVKRLPTTKAPRKQENDGPWRKFRRWKKPKFPTTVKSS